mmetsp:Transcript_7374/g.31435  ORF Transcript_7374/g.31435 Transcript_7374/m.31435 type:complete len:237 (-) Transcript_7374:1422-2132(-)
MSAALVFPLRVVVEREARDFVPRALHDAPVEVAKRRPVRRDISQTFGPRPRMLFVPVPVLVAAPQREKTGGLAHVHERLTLSPHEQTRDRAFTVSRASRIEPQQKVHRVEVRELPLEQMRHGSVFVPRAAGLEDEPVALVRQLRNELSHELLRAREGREILTPHAERLLGEIVRPALAGFGEKRAARVDDALCDYTVPLDERFIDEFFPKRRDAVVHQKSPPLASVRQIINHHLAV